MRAASLGPQGLRSRLSRLPWLTFLLSIVFGMPGPSSGQDQAEALSSRFRAAAKRVLPAVVTVRGTNPLADPRGDLRPGPGPRDSGGSGILVDAEGGYVLTNDHVVEEGLREGGPLLVLLPDGEERVVIEVRRDPKSDLALLLIEPDNLPASLISVDWGDSENLEIGDWVLAVGQPFGLSGTVTAGIISGKGRAVGVALYEDLLQTDAAINPGNSGGPLVNLKGEVVGINVAIKTIHGGYEGVGFAVPSWRARRVAADLAKLGKVRRVYLGLGIGGATRPGKGPVTITSVALGGPAERAGLRAGDQIVQLGDRPVEGAGMLMSAVEFAPAGEPLLLKIRRDEQDFEVEIRPEPQPEAFGLPGSRPAPLPLRIDPRGRADLGTEGVSRSEPARNPTPIPDSPAMTSEPTRFESLGLLLQKASPLLVSRYGFSTEAEGLVILGVEAASPADLGGLEPGMLITNTLDEPLREVSDLRDVLADRTEQQPLILRIQKGTKTEYRVLWGQ